MNITPTAAPPSFIRGWWTYQRERFPLPAHGPLIAAFSFCAVSYSRMVRGANGLPPWTSLFTAFVICLLFLLQLRIADEFKDIEEDTRWRPYRPVPRGLVTLRALGVLYIAAAAVQLTAALLLRPALALLLLLPWAYLAAMSHEFGVRDWLMARPITYLWTHMLIMPPVDFFATGCDWLAPHTAPPADEEEGGPPTPRSGACAVRHWHGCPSWPRHLPARHSRPDLSAARSTSPPSSASFSSARR